MRFREHAFDWIAWAMFAAIPAVIFWQSATSLAEQGAASGGPMENAAFYPRVVASVMAVLVACQAVRLALGRVRQTSPLGVSVGTHLAFAATALFLIYIVALPYAGFHLATPVLCFALFRILGLGLLAAAAGAVALWISTAFVFEGLLNVVLPVGIFNLALFN